MSKSSAKSTPYGEAMTAWDEYWRAKTSGHFVGPSNAIREAAADAFMAGRESIAGQGGAVAVLRKALPFINEAFMETPQLGSGERFEIYRALCRALPESPFHDKTLAASSAVAQKTELLAALESAQHYMRNAGIDMDRDFPEIQAAIDKARKL